MNQELTIQTLGRLDLKLNGVVFPTGRKRSAQVELLIIYLIMNRSRQVSISQFIDFLWPNGNSDKPEGALRNLIYRARKELKRFYCDEVCIQSKGHAYFWNQDIPCFIDYENLMDLASQVMQQKNLSQQYEYAFQMLEAYHNDFLPEYNYHYWVIEQNNLLETTCLNALIGVVHHLESQEQYNEIIQLLTHPHAQRFIDSRLYEARLWAYYKTEQTDIGLNFYRQVVDYYYSQYGIEVTPRLKEIYQLFLNTLPTTQVNVEQLEENLSFSQDQESTFYCDFDVFKNIYQVNVRSARRSMKARVLALLTLEDATHSLTERELIEESEILRKVISSSLRKNDVFSKFNMTQYSLIIASPDLHGAQIAVERIVRSYQEKQKHQESHLKTELRKIN